MAVDWIIRMGGHHHKPGLPGHILEESRPDRIGYPFPSSGACSEAWRKLSAFRHQIQDNRDLAQAPSPSSTMDETRMGRGGGDPSWEPTRGANLCFRVQLHPIPGLIPSASRLQHLPSVSDGIHTHSWTAPRRLCTMHLPI